MKTGFVIIYTLPPSIDWLFFRCDSEDGDSAEDFLLRTFPAAEVVGVYRGEFASDALRAMQREMGWDKEPEFNAPAVSA